MQKYAVDELGVMYLHADGDYYEAAEVAQLKSALAVAQVESAKAEVKKTQQDAILNTHGTESF